MITIIEKLWSDKKNRILMIIGYTFLILPIVFSMFFSVPASDDFIYGSFVSSDNVFINALAYIKHTYTQGSCRWLVFFLQKCINPLNPHVHLGHKYGLSVIIVFTIAISIIIYSVRFIVGVFVEDIKSKSLISFVIMALLLSTYYYSEVYNWYTGATAYAIPFSLMMLTFVYMIKYFRYGHNKKDYIMLFVAGILPITNEFFCVPMGIVYLYFLLNDVEAKNDKNRKIKNLWPLVFYIIMGSTVVFTPGNMARRGRNEITAPMWRLAIQPIINTVIRVKDIITTHPFAVILFVILFYLGVKNKGEKIHNIKLFICLFGIGIIGAILPYSLGVGKTDTYMDVRLYYVLDYLLLLSMSLTILMMGQNFAHRHDIVIDKRTSLRWGIIIGLFSYLMLVPQHEYLKITQVDILKKSGLIRESYALWDGILSEIENSDEADVVITRDRAVEWSPYFLYVGLEPGEVYDQSFDAITPVDEIMINVYYKKNTIILNYEE
ncbi:hypothetical protein [Pseudobutyrivibrio xylanivorans]|uniref:Glucosyl transferase GtrII n=1 Tax=Pseudobutyrivibrio xylanivorans TaxID=185007 RepID=A0A1G5RX94_PSEXY|nr:hypothetical protein [Pseudobutyrivibrio xylanivorans]SCZ78626.1 hypothetical protein SAMN02910350_01366 [Pseudobutyrivibrio xylanivorans]